MDAHRKDELLALTPARYLAGGFTDPAGRPRPELRSTYATAAATQLLRAELAPQELAFTFEALRQLLPLHGEGPAPRRVAEALEEALSTVARMIRQPNNQGLVTWSRDCAASIKKVADIEVLLDHMHAVLRQYAVLASLPPPDASLSGSSPVQGRA